MKSIVRIGGPGKQSRSAAVAATAELNALGSRVELIQALIPLGLEAVRELLQQEVTALAGARYQRGGGVAGYARWGRQSGSVYLADQKVAVAVPRVRDVRRDQEVPLTTYQSLRQPRRAEDQPLRGDQPAAPGDELVDESTRLSIVAMDAVAISPGDQQVSGRGNRRARADRPKHQ